MIQIKQAELFENFDSVDGRETNSASVMHTSVA